MAIHDEKGSSSNSKRAQCIFSHHTHHRFNLIHGAVLHQDPNPRHEPDCEKHERERDAPLDGHSSCGSTLGMSVEAALSAHRALCDRRNYPADIHPPALFKTAEWKAAGDELKAAVKALTRAEKWEFMYKSLVASNQREREIRKRPHRSSKYPERARRTRYLERYGA